MQIKINGDKRQVRDRISISELLEELNIERQGIAVEQNKVVIPKSEHNEKIISEGDVIEIIQMVGGG
ncbi:MAG: sulfur carrier protein ThiS [Deltaproteobacteria bacterium]|nr:sulfur carrier protein ThiS [Deltaproteobacteria bacterium]